MAARKLDPQQEAQRAVIREVMGELWKVLVADDDAVEGIELFAWHTLPYTNALAVEILLPPDPVGATATPEPIPAETALPPTVTIGRWKSGTVHVKTNFGTIVLDWWAGADRYHRQAVICCGPGPNQ